MRRTNNFKKTYKTRFTAEAKNCIKEGVTLKQITAVIDAHFEADGGIPELLRKKWSLEVITELSKEPKETIADRVFKWIKS